MTELSDKPKTSVSSLGQAKWQSILDGLQFGTQFKMLLNKSILGAWNTPRNTLKFLKRFICGEEGQSCAHLLSLCITSSFLSGSSK